LNCALCVEHFIADCLTYIIEVERAMAGIPN